jgi:SHAQKYF class myb-like DNA-binding protein
MPFRIRTTLCGTAPLVNPFPFIVSSCDNERARSNNPTLITENAYELDKQLRVMRDCKGHVIWAGPLQDRFLYIMNLLGSDAVPSTILDLMNVPELTRENIGSHLQKYKKQKRARVVRIHPPLNKMKSRKLSGTKTVPPSVKARKSVNKTF